jgi:hypothetical protein
LSAFAADIVVIALRVAFAAFAIAGVSLALYVGRDAHQDLVVRRLAGINGTIELIGRIARTSAYEVAMPLHIGFLLLAVLSSFGPIPSGAPWISTVAAYLVFCGIQALVIRGQIRVVRWRRKVRAA